MEVSTSYHCQPTVSFKYGSFQESDDVSMMDEEMYYGSYNSHCDSSGFMYDNGSIGEEEEASSNDDGEEMCSETTDSDMTESLIDDDFNEDPENEIDEDENENDNEDEWTNQKRNATADSSKQNTLAHFASKEMLRLRFPFQSIAIRISDFCALQENDVLNDTMIDFYLNHIVQHVLPDNIDKKVNVLPSVFWHNLSLRQHAVDSEDMKHLTEDERMDLKFKDLHEFVEDFDLQDFEYIVIPVNEWEHWSLAVICHPFTSRARTVIFDSQLTADLNNLQNMAGLLEEFLNYSWGKRTGKKISHSLPCVVPIELPQQTNNFDCGVFILEFAERFLMSPPKDLDTFDFTRQYPDFKISGKRAEMQRAILALSPEPAQWRPLVEFLNGINTAAPHRSL
ncbi:unnamed protein product [Caenorhabditis angaria]|uniref:Ubiquitin-like protease family profile domain-containing protein n=1 Tax=Caenorhabditis angaria TaxID=860376 RepID=A0A9P1IDL5_9PELO|nr:unnamed protein product [Caenorhabditis angaria]